MISTYIYILHMCVVSGVTKSKGLKKSSVHSDSSMVPHGSQQSDITLTVGFIEKVSIVCLMIPHAIDIKLLEQCDFVKMPIICIQCFTL